MGEFVQCEPRHENSFTSDSFLQSSLRRLVPGPVLETIRADLTLFGHRCATDIQVSLRREVMDCTPALAAFRCSGENVKSIPHS